MPKIYFCTADYQIAETLKLMDNCVYETTLEEFLKLTKKIFEKPMEYTDLEWNKDIPLQFSTDRNKIHKICTALFVPFEDTYPVSETEAVKEIIEEGEAAENIIKVA